MAMQWTPDLSVGIKEIDDQHKELINRLNALGEAMMKGMGKDEIGRLLDFLGSYVVTHFGTEERYMAAHNYPASASHKLQHAQLVSDFKKFRAEFDQAGAKLTLVLGLNAKLIAWLKEHICGTDKLLGGFLKTEMKA
jgi:hemerythrin